MFPAVEEGGLTMYRIAIVQNPHLTKLAGVGFLVHYYSCDADSFSTETELARLYAVRTWP
jgi:dsRNA-specific ribonuclease